MRTRARSLPRNRRARSCSSAPRTSALAGFAKRSDERRRKESTKKGITCVTAPLARCRAPLAPLALYAAAAAAAATARIFYDGDYALRITSEAAAIRRALPALTRWARRCRLVATRCCLWPPRRFLVSIIVGRFYCSSEARELAGSATHLLYAAILVVKTSSL